jgi:hypothetical protein
MAENAIGSQTFIDPADNQANNPLRDKGNSREGDPRQPSIVANNPQMPAGFRQRQLMRWDIPGAPAYVDMYINPQQFTIQEKKVISRRRTKGGYIVQYWGEELPTISISGSTAAAGIEGINILRGVYRAEQNAFEQVAQTLNDRLGSFSLGGLAGSIRGAATNPGRAIGSAIASLFSSGVNPPLLPTLGSLALAVSLYYQGAVYKGYFTDFSVDESVAQGVGVFNYRMSFQVTDTRGLRRNFMPWHKSPADIDPVTGQPTNFRRSDYETTPLSFNGEG